MLFASLPKSPRLNTLARLSWPVAANLVAQSLLGLVSTATAGRLGDAALAGVGVANALFSILLALLFGLDAGVQTLVARRLGSGDEAGAGVALRRGLLLCGALGVALGGAAFLVGPPAVAVAIRDPAAARAGGDFLKGFAPILPLLGLNMTFSAYWYGARKAGRAMAVTLLQLPLHAALVWGLALGVGPVPALGAFGAGLGASLAAAAALATHVALAFRIAPVRGLAGEDEVAGAGGEWAVYLRIGLPISLQQSLLYVCLALSFAVIARIGTGSAAAINGMNALAVVASLAAGGVGTAAASLVGAAVGRGEAGDAGRWGWQAAAFGVAVLSPFCLAVAAWPQPALALFIGNPRTVELAAWPMRILALAMLTDSFAWILAYSLRGAGTTVAASGASFVLQWAVQLPLSWWVGVRLGLGLTGVMAVYAARSVIEATVMSLLWRRWGRRQAAVPQDGGPPPRRIVVMGGAGAGKSTLARALGERLGLPVTHLDRLYFGPDWRAVGEAAFRDRVAEALAGDAWVVEGTYHEASQISLPRADLVIWLDRPALLRLWRSWNKVRRHRGQVRADRPDGCEEGFSLRYAAMIFSFGAWTGRVEASVRRVAAQARVICLRSDAEARTALERLAT